MITAIVNKIISDLQTLPFLDRVGGIVKILTQNKPNDSGGVYTMRYPAVFNLTPQTCSDASTYKDMIPNSDYMSLLYFEHKNTITTEAGADYQKKETVIRLVFWGNMAKINPVYTDTDLIAATIIASIPKTYQPFSGVSAIYIELISEVVKNSEIFADYTYNESEKQYLIYPYDYFALDFRVTYQIANQCLADLVLSPDVCETAITSCQRLWNNLTDYEKLSCLLPQYDFAQAEVLNALTAQQILDLTSNYCNLDAYTCEQLKAGLSDIQKTCIIQEQGCPGIFNSLTNSQKECILKSYDFSDGSIFSILTNEQLIDITAQLDCIVLQNLTSQQLIDCILPLYDFSDTGVIAGLSAQQISDIEVNICPVPPSITADFLIDINPVNAYFTDVTFTENCTGNPLAPDTFIWSWLEDGVYKSYVGASFTTKINALGSISITLTASNSVNGASGQKTYVVTSNAYLPINPVLWLDAMRGITLNGSNVSNWTDGTNNFTQSTVGNQPLLIPNYRNGKSVIYFNGTTFNLLGNNLNLHNSSFTVMLVIQANLAFAANNYMYKMGADTRFVTISYRQLNSQWRYIQHIPATIGLFSYDNNIMTQFKVVTLVKTLNSNVKMYINEELTHTLTTAGLTNAYDSGDSIIGSEAVAFGEFYLSDLVVFNSALSDANIASLVEIFKRKMLIS